MGKSLWIICILCAAIAAPAFLRADTVYNVNQSIGSGSATGFITTDGSIGTLTLANIVGWDLTLNDGTNVTDLIPSNSSVFFGNHDLGVGNVDVTATSQNLMFNYGAPDGGFLSFGGASGELCYTAWSNCWGPTAVGVYGVAGVGGSVYVGESGNQVIAAAVPEPSSFLLLCSGLGIATTGVRRKLRW
jgi:hypothetical protein